MKILYASCRYDPLDRDSGSGVDFNLFEVFKKCGYDLKIVGPFTDEPSISERIYRKVHRLFSNKNPAKFSEAYLHYSSSMVDKEANEFQPDVIFSHNLIPLVYLKSKVPIVYKSDSFLFNTQKQWPTYSRFEFNRMLNWEKKVLNKSSLIITASKWAQEALIDYYKVPIARIMIIPIPSSLPNSVIPRTYEQRKGPGNELHLLSVAKNYQFKGVDIAIQTVEMLRIKGINASLHVVGMKGESTDFIKFMGLCKKKNPNELAQYVAQYKWADLLIHPARVEAAGIVCSEAAAFGVPTITNASGGLATTVDDGVSGIVLPINSPAEMYAEAIEKLLENRQQYFELQKSTRQRFETELNWDVAGNRIIREIHRVLEV